VLNTVLIFFGAGFGGVVRYGVSNLIHSFLGRNFPYGTLIVNISGCFLMGFLFTLLLDRFSAYNPQLRAFLLIGFLGGYTTFSSFSIETLNLIESGSWMSASFNILFSMILCMLGVWLGVIGGRQI